MALQIRRGTDAERQSITPAEGELIYATDTNQLFVGGKISPSPTLSQGGILVSGALVNDTNPTLSSNLDLNGNDITGTGNISVNGNITATGNINLGDGVEDNVIVGGQIRSDLIPGLDGIHDLGAAGAAWKDLYAVAINVETTASVGDLEVINNIISPDSSVILDVDNLNLTINNATVSGNIDIGGNLISNSTVVYNSTTGDITAGNITSTGYITSNTVITDSITAGDGILEVTGSIEVTGNADVTGTLVSGSVLTGSITGDLTGSVFSDDSTLVIDGITGAINAVGGVTLTGPLKGINNQPIVVESPNTGQTLSVNGITSGLFGAEATLTIDGSKGSLDSPQDTGANDIFGALKVRGYNNGNQVVGSIQQTSWASDANFTEVHPKSNWRLLVNAGDGNGIQGTGFSYMDLTSNGVLEGPIFKMKIFATTTARDAEITAPEAGMTVFVTDGDGVGNPKFQGYDGSAWVNLN